MVPLRPLIGREVAKVPWSVSSAGSCHNFSEVIDCRAKDTEVGVDCRSMPMDLTSHLACRLNSAVSIAVRQSSSQSLRVVHGIVVN